LKFEILIMDTRDKRASAMGDLLFPELPYPDAGVLTQFDRQMVTGIYAGIEYTVSMGESSVCLSVVSTPRLAFGVLAAAGGLAFEILSEAALTAEAAGPQGAGRIALSQAVAGRAGLSQAVADGAALDMESDGLAALEFESGSGGFGLAFAVSGGFALAALAAGRAKLSQEISGDGALSQTFATLKCA
jgi:hypothetical protein